MTAVLAACSNDPHPAGWSATNTLFVAMQERTPRHLDPTASYAVNEAPITYAVHEPLYAYHHLLRPYVLVPKAAAAVTAPRLVDAAGTTLPDDAPAEQVAESVYDIPLRHGMRYAPHPAFATDADGRHLYHSERALDAGRPDGRRTPFDVARTGTREVVADDFVYAVRRLATPRIQSPAYGLLAERIVGFDRYGAVVRAAAAGLPDLTSRSGVPDVPGVSGAAAVSDVSGADVASDASGADTASGPVSPDQPFLDFRRIPFDGVQALDRYTLRIRVRGRHPQFPHWLATAFFAPVPWEADAFYAQPGMSAAGLSGDVWPVAAGPFMVREFAQDRRLVLERNPNYHGLPYPCQGMPGDRAAGLLDDCGKPMPFLDRMVFDVERDTGPLLTKFVQGYFDVPEERADWAQVFRAGAAESASIAVRDRERGFRYAASPEPFLWYLGFNWLDPVVGGGETDDERVRHRKLRQALSIAIDWEEGYGRIFLEKAGVAAQGPVPPGVFGGCVPGPGCIDPVTHTLQGDRPVRRPIAEARRLLAEAGYPDGRDALTGRRLQLFYDYQRVPTPDSRAELDWMTRQFARLGIELDIRSSDYNQFQRRVLGGHQQIYLWGWSADYPDAENFLALLYGPNGKARHGGENTANYENPEYDALYRRMATLADGPDKQRSIDRMVDIARSDAPWSFGYVPYLGAVHQSWLHNAKFGLFDVDRALYERVDVGERVRRQRQWNQRVWWPLFAAAVVAMGLAVAVRRSWRRRQSLTAFAS